MSEELLQRGLDKKPEKFGKWDFYNIGSTTVKALKSYGIIRSVDYGDIEGKKIDALIVNKKKVIAVIEYKKPQEFKTKKQKQAAIKQEIVVAQKLGSKIIIATDTKESVWVNTLTGAFIKDENGDQLKINFDVADEKQSLLIEKINYSINEMNNQILPKELTDPTNLAKSIWQDIWSVSGATPENCLYTFVELFIFKFLSDLGILDGMYSFDTLMGMYKTDSENDVLKYYADTIRPKIKDLFPYNPQDNTTIINGTIFVSKEQKAVDGYGRVFKKVLGQFRDYQRLENIDHDFKSKLFESFMKESISKKNWGQFFTPMKIVRAIEQMAKDEIKEGVSICDPACGVGKFLLEPIKSRLERFFPVNKNGVTPKITIRGFDKGFDKDEQKTIILAKANMLIYFSELIKEYPSNTKDFAHLFNDCFTLKTTSILGTLQDPVESEYDLILTNPPYVTSGSSNLKDQIKKDGALTNHYKINAIGVEGLFMEWIVRALKPNGKAFIVVPDGIFNRQNDKNLRDFLLEECYIDGIISLPLNTFFTTNKKTYILCITKKNKRTDKQTSPVFTYLVSEIGESRDVYRFDIEQDDLTEAVTLYCFFKGNKDGFEKIDRDPRCKVFPISTFENENQWSVERWWTKEEKTALGIEEENQAIKFEELPYFLENIADNIMGFKNIILELNEKKKYDLEFSEMTIGKMFDLPPIRGLTKEFIETNKGDIPVYGGKTFEEPIGYVADNLLNVKYFENCLAWNREGSVGYTFWHKHKFTTNDHHRPLKLKDIFVGRVDLEYLRQKIQETLLKQGFRWSQTASKEKVAKIKVPIPILSNGEIDVEAQQKIVLKNNAISDLMAKAIEYQQEFNNIDVIVDNKYVCKEVPIKEIFYVNKGIAKYTRLYGNRNRGEFPVYSASSQAPLTHIDTYDFDGKYLTWATNGFAGFMMILDEKFSINGDRGILIPKIDNIDVDYIKFILEPILRCMAKGRKGDKGEDEFTKVYPSMVENVKIVIPVDELGDYDINSQQEIADKYRRIEEIKKAIILELKKLQNTSVFF